MLEGEATRMNTHDPNDPLSVYISEGCNVEPLTKDEEAKLFRELGARADWDEASENVARRLIESQLALVVSIAQKHSTSSVSTLDLVQEGNLGLMNAVRSFAESPTGDFAQHANTCIEEAITKALGKSK